LRIGQQKTDYVVAGQKLDRSSTKRGEPEVAIIGRGQMET